MPVLTADEQIAALEARLQAVEAQQATWTRGGLERTPVRGLFQPVAETGAGVRQVAARADHDTQVADITPGSEHHVITTLDGLAGWKFPYGRVTNVKDSRYGAKGDGSDDTAAFKLALAAAEASGGSRILYIPNGTYYLSSTLGTLTTDGIYILGESKAGSVIYLNDALGTMDLIDIGTTDKFQVENLTIRAGIARTGGTVFTAAAATLSRFNNLHIYECYNAFVYVGTQFHWTDVYVQNGATGSTSLRTTGQCGGVITNSAIIGAAGFRPTYGWYADSGAFDTVGLIVNGCTTGVQWEIGNGSAMDAGVFERFQPDSNVGDNMVVNCTGTGVARMNDFTDCFWGSSSTGRGLVLNGASGINGATFTNCRFVGNGQHGIEIQGIVGNVQFIGCSIAGNSASGANTYSGAYIAAGVGGFHFGWCDVGSYGLWSYANGDASAPQKYGIEIATGASDGYQVVDCDLGGNQTGGLFDGGSGVLKKTGPNFNDYAPNTPRKLTYTGTLWSDESQSLIGINTPAPAYPLDMNYSSIGGTIAARTSNTATSGESRAVAIVKSDGSEMWMPAYASTFTGNNFGLARASTSGLIQLSGNRMVVGTNQSAPLYLGTVDVQRLLLDTLGNIVPGTAALATTATDGFIYLPSSAGAPTGVPTAYTGRIPTEYDTTNNRPYWYNGAWRWGIVNTLFTAKGDLLTASAASTPVILPIGATSDVLQVVSGTNAYVSVGAMLAKLLTTKGDIPYSPSNAGAVVALPIGSSNDLLTVSSGAPVWQSVPTMMGTVLTTNGDILYRNGSGTVTRLAVGANDSILYVASSLPAYGTQATVYGKTLTNRGSLLYASAAGVGAQLNVGAAATMMMSDGNDPVWTSTAWTAVSTGASLNATTSSGTWTIDDGDLAPVVYSIVGKTMHLSFNVFTSSLSGAPASLSFTIPGGKTANRRHDVLVRILENGGAGESIGFARTAAGSTSITIVKQAGNFAIITNNLYILFQMTLEIQ